MYDIKKVSLENNYKYHLLNKKIIKSSDSKSINIDKKYNYIDGMVRNFDTDELVNKYKREWATVSNTYFSIGEGVAKFGESIFDTLASVGSVVDSSVVELFGNYELAQRLRNDTQALVAKSYISELYDNFYDNTSIGRNIKDKSYGFATTRAIGNGVGYTVGIIVTCVLTAGVGSFVSGGCTIASISFEVTPTLMATWGGIAGFGKSADEAWNDGAGYWTGLGYASLTAGWEALQFYLGGKINTIAPFNSTGANVGLRVGLDTLDGGVEGFVQPLLQAIYHKGYVDPKTGEYIEFNNDSNYLDKVKEIWKQQGGFKSVAINSAIALSMSLVGETSQLLIAANKSKSMIVDELKTNGAEIEVSSKKVETSEIDSSAKHSLDLNSSTNGKEMADDLSYLKELDEDIPLDELIEFKSTDLEGYNRMILLNQKAKELVDTSEFGIRMDSEKLTNVLESGRIKSIFETNGSGYAADGVHGLTQREMIESKIFHRPKGIYDSSTGKIDLDMAEKYSPVYGTLFPSEKSAFDDYIVHGPGAGYGMGNNINKTSEIVIVMNKDAVIDNCTITYGDSLDGELVPTLAANPKYNDSTTLTSFDEFFESNNLSNASLEELTGGPATSEYIEFQMHGAQTKSIDNIKEIVFNGVEPTPEQLKIMKENGINWRVINI